MISADDQKEEVRARVDIADLVREYVPDLKRAGRTYKARCPFHQERTPSFIVNSERQSYHCFGCAEGGDVFSFVMKIENLSFREALEKLAERAGVKLQTSRDPESPEEKRKGALRELMSRACAYFQEKLSSPEGEAARAYAEKRGLSAEARKRFELGFSTGRGELIALAGKKGFDAALLEAAGLAAARDGRLREYFFNRLLFPIRDAKGQVVGFGGRTLGDGEPKYLNSPETALFSKGKVLYGLHQGLAEIRKARRVLLMEGYMDVIAAHEHGFTTACAPLGTALTEEHASMLKRYADEAIVVFDPDRAGISAASKSGQLLLARGIAVKIATVPEGLDPDEFLRKNGSVPFTKCLDAAVDVAEFQTEASLRARPELTAEAKAAVVKEVMPVISACSDEVVKDEWMRRLAQRLKVSEDAVLKQADKKAGARAPARAAGPVKAAALTARDEHDLWYLIRQPSLAELVERSDFDSEEAWTIAAAIAKTPAEPPSSFPSRLLEALSGAQRECASRLIVDDRGGEPGREFTTALERRRQEARMRQLESIVFNGKQAVDPVLLAEYQKLAVELKGTRKTAPI